MDKSDVHRVERPVYPMPLDELERGDSYMKMHWHFKPRARSGDSRAR